MYDLCMYPKMKKTLSPKASGKKNTNKVINDISTKITTFHGENADKP